MATDTSRTISILKEIVDRNGPNYLISEPYRVFTELIGSGTTKNYTRKYNISAASTRRWRKHLPLYSSRFIHWRTEKNAYSYISAGFSMPDAYATALEQND